MYLKLFLLLIVVSLILTTKEGYYACVDKYGDNLKNLKEVYIPQLVGYVKNDYLYKAVPVLESDEPFGVNPDFFKY